MPSISALETELSLSYPLHGIELRPFPAQFEMQYRLVAIFRIAVDCTQVLVCPYFFSHSHIYARQIGIYRYVTAVAHHDHFVIAVLRKYTAHGPFENASGFSPFRRRYVDAGIVCHHIREIGMRLPPESFHYGVPTSYRKEQSAAVALETARKSARFGIA